MTTLAAPILAHPTAPLARRNPLAKFGAAFVLMFGLFLTVDLVTPALVLVIELVALASAGMRPSVLARRLAIVALAAAGVFVATALFTDDRSGTTLLTFGPIEATTGSLLTAAAIAVRIFAIALPGVIAIATTDPTELADALVQQLHAPARFTFGTLAAFRMVPLLGEEWRTLVFARRARGMDHGWSPLRRTRVFFATVFALLVAAIRRGVRLATAMEARGFGHRSDRSAARPITMSGADWVLLAAAIALMVGATVMSMAVGSWTFVF